MDIIFTMEFTHNFSEVLFKVCLGRLVQNILVELLTKDLPQTKVVDHTYGSKNGLPVAIASRPAKKQQQKEKWRVILQKIGSLQETCPV